MRQGPRWLLEIGAGCGTEVLWLALQGALVTSIDVNEKRLKVGRVRQAFVEKQLGQTLNVDLRLQSLFDLDELVSFDIIWME